MFADRREGQWESPIGGTITPSRDKRSTKQEKPPVDLDEVLRNRQKWIDAALQEIKRFELEIKRVEKQLEDKTIKGDARAKLRVQVYQLRDWVIAEEREIKKIRKAPMPKT